MLDGLISKNAVIVVQSELSVLEDSLTVVFVVGYFNILQFEVSGEFNIYLFGYIIVFICVLCGSTYFAGNLVNGFGTHSTFSVLTIINT